MWQHSLCHWTEGVSTSWDPASITPCWHNQRCKESVWGWGIHCQVCLYIRHLRLEIILPGIGSTEDKVLWWRAASWLDNFQTNPCDKKLPNKIFFKLSHCQEEFYTLTRSLREPAGPCTKSMEVSESRMERVKYRSKPSSHNAAQSPTSSAAVY